MSIRALARPFGEEIRTGSVDSILASLYRVILRNRGITEEEFNYRLEGHIAKYPSQPSLDNLGSELMKNTMTWKVFCKGIRLFEVHRFDMTLHLHHPTKSVTVHKNSFYLNSYGQEKEYEDIDRQLASYYRDILLTLGINMERFNDLMESYLDSVRDRISANIHQRAGARVNLKRELLKPTMTWRVFCKGIQFLNVTQLDISIDLFWPHNRVSNHRKTVILSLAITEYDEHE